MHKIVAHDYFLDEMQIIDIPIATRYLDYAEVLSWAQTRQIMLCQLKPYLKNKKTTAEQLFSLPIDDDGIDHTTEVTNEDIERWNKMKHIFAKMNTET